MQSISCIKQRDSWEMKDFFLLLFIAFVAVPLLIETYLYNLFETFFKDTFYSGTLIGFFMSILFTLSLYYISIKPHALSFKEIGLVSFERGYWKQILLWTLALIVLSTFIMIFMSLMGGTYENAKTESIQQSISPLILLIGLLSASVVSPIYEELFYRGFIYRFVRNRLGIFPGNMISSSLFTLAHIPTYNTLPVNFLSGLIFAWTYEKTNSVIPAIIIHGLFNGIAVLLTAFAS
ncbi:CAAX protease [Bacillus sp. HMSC76G11]|nr:CAAX protease [Bacillus sp. HMSC76G11]